MTLVEFLTGIVAGAVVVRIYYWAEHRLWRRRCGHLLRVQIVNKSAPTTAELKEWRP